MSKRIVVMVSGGGSNLQSIIDSIADGDINGEIVGVISDKSGVFALERAESAEIPTFVILKKELRVELLAKLEELNPDLIVLAGFLSKIQENVVWRFRNKIINLHPALIPSFCGDGMYGSSVHEAVLARGVKLSGVTIHFVDEGTDSGPIILQETVEVLENDTVESLAERIHEIEHELLPKAVKMFCEDRLKVSGHRVLIRV